MAGEPVSGRGIGVSVVIPARNEGRAIGGLLRALQRQTRRPDEVLVVDAGSTDDTREAALAEHPHVRVVSAGPALPGAARNAGIRAAACNWIALIDAGCTPGDDWVARLTAPCLADDDVQVVFGDYSPVLSSEWDVAQALAILAPRSATHHTRGPSTASMLIRRQTWSQAGGFPEDLRAAEDLVFFDRLKAMGVRTAWAPHAIVQWEMAAGPTTVFQRLRLYSAYHFRAGLSRSWHQRVVLMDLVAVGLLAIGFWIPWAWVVAALGAFGRLLSTIWKRRSNAGGRTPFRPDRLGRIALLLCLADLAAWAGLVDLACGRVPRS